MEIHQQEHIQRNLDDLIINTNINAIFVSVLKGKEAFGDFDTAELDSIPIRFDKVRRFYEIVITRSNSYDALCEALNETKQSGSLKILKSLKHDQYLRLHGRQNGIRFNVSAPTFMFTGRAKELEELHHLLETKSATSILATVVVGQAGIGKSDFCRKYVQQFSLDYDNNVIWMEGRDLAEGFRTIAKDKLKINLKDVDGGKKDVKTVVDEVYQFFTEQKCLFIFDGVDSSSFEDLDDLLPIRGTKNSSRQVIITSRDKSWDLPFNLLEMKGLDVVDAVEFVKNGLRIDDGTQDQDLLELVNRLEFNPFALTKAIAFIKRQQTTRAYDTKRFLERADALKLEN